jgi:thioredoxin 1
VLIQGEMQKMVDEITSDKLDEVVKKHKVVAVDCYTTSCQPCKVLSPILAELDELYSSDGLKVVKMNMEKNLEFGMENELMSVPVVIFYSQGKRVKFNNDLGNETDKIVGLMSADDYQDIIDALLFEDVSIIKL